MRLCTIGTCRKPARARGMCGMHYERKRRLGTTEIVVKTEDERFWENVDNTAGPYGCWPWRGSHNQGRAMFGLKVDGQWCQRFATRLIYEKVIGQIPEGHDIHHDCYNGWCVNPRHLRPLDPHLNKVLGAGRVACKRGHEYNEQNTYLRANGSVQCRVCSNAQQRAARKAASTDMSKREAGFAA